MRLSCVGLRDHSAPHTLTVANATKVVTDPSSVEEIAWAVIVGAVATRVRNVEVVQSADHASQRVWAPGVREEGTRSKGSATTAPPPPAGPTHMYPAS